MLISIITINYNDKLGLKKTINSVRSQTYSNFEHIIIDGGSNDGSKEQIVANKDYLAYWVSERDNGIYNAMNKGIKVAKGEYLFFLNSGDDFTDKYALKNLSIYLKGTDIVYFNINQIQNNSIKLKRTPKVLSFDFLHSDLPPHQSTFIHKRLFEEFGYYDEHLKIVSDWKFLIEVLIKHNATYEYIDEVYTNFYKDGISSLPENINLIKEEREEVLNNEYTILMNDLKYKYKLERTLRTLRKSRKIKILIKLGLINRF
ncbi:glycosyltransferase family 2 protein [Flavivirga abyssicola]|uniref:glycosyltransferase family 2 protein n=1 Tax=Flavivirga abyssicola TaxID=3063533 RepID=UPI0026DFC821|nr:glycosyltransferase family 2 protein [Flavivirga sp. MEBiC07777]WVK13646.1 glycosyltransferase family 2 protein [Flavivirga sp. MEBiC07777]